MIVVEVRRCADAGQGIGEALVTHVQPHTSVLHGNPAYVNVPSAAFLIDAVGLRRAQIKTHIGAVQSPLFQSDLIVGKVKFQTFGIKALQRSCHTKRFGERIHTYHNIFNVNFAQHKEGLADGNVIKACREFSHVHQRRAVLAFQHVHILHLQFEREADAYLPHLIFQVIARLVQIRHNSTAHHILHRRDVERKRQTDKNQQQRNDSDAYHAPYPRLLFLRLCYLFLLFFHEPFEPSNLSNLSNPSLP